MKNRQSLFEGLALALAGVLLLAGIALAQNQGKGKGLCPVGQVCTGGPNGTCSVNPAPQQGNQNCPGPGKAQKRQDMKGSPGGQRAPQGNPPAANQ